MTVKKDYSEDSKNFYFNEQNKKKQKELTDKYGMVSSEPNEDTPPEIMNSFLNQVEQFEEQYSNAENKRILEILEFPEFKNIETINSEELKEEIERVLEIYASKNIYIDIIEEDEVTEESFYKFITEELPQHETYFMEIEGMNTNFIYEEFHPSNKLNAKDAVNFFSYPYFEKKSEEMKTWLSKEGLQINGQSKSLTEFINDMISLIPGKVIKKNIVFNAFEFGELNKVDVNFDLVCEVDDHEIPKLLNIVFDLENSEFGGFDIKGCNVRKLFEIS